MIPRYTRPEMGAVWTDRNKFQQWLEVELAASETLADLGVFPLRMRYCCAATLLLTCRASSRLKNRHAMT